MKKTIAIVLTLFAGIGVFGKTMYTTQNPNQITATFKGVTEEGAYKFIDAQKKVYLFEDIDYEIDIDLYDDEYLNKNFKIVWEDDEMDIYDEEGDATGETTKIKRITQLQSVK